MRGKRKLKVHWVNGVEGREEIKKKTKPNTKPTLPTKPQHKKTTTPDGVGEKKKSGVGERSRKGIKN